MEILAPIAIGAQIVSAISSYQESRAQSDAIKRTATFNQIMSEQEAQQERASASIAASEERRAARIMSSDILGASKGPVDPTTVNIIGGVMSEGELRARTRVFEGERKASNIDTGADLDAWQAKVSAASERRRGITTALGKFGQAAAMTGQTYGRSAKKEGGK
jgi:hypothetical protein